MTVPQASALLDAARSYIMARQDAITLYTHDDQSDASTSACPPAFKRKDSSFCRSFEKTSFFPWKNRLGKNSIYQVEKQFFYV
jgi:hypothetical protein